MSDNKSGTNPAEPVAEDRVAKAAVEISATAEERGTVVTCYRCNTTYLLRPGQRHICWAG